MCKISRLGDTGSLEQGRGSMGRWNPLGRKERRKKNVSYGAEHKDSTHPSWSRRALKQTSKRESNPMPTPQVDAPSTGASSTQGATFLC